MDGGRYDGSSSFEAIELAQATPGTGGAAAVGRVDTVIGRVTITRTDGTQLTAESGQPIFQGDQVTTAVDGKLGIVFADNSSFSIGERGNMTIDEMVYDPGTQTGKSVVNITTGVFSFVSGQLAKSGPESMVLHTPVAVIGIRGTTGAGKAAPVGSPNTFALLPDASGGTGEVSVTTQTGTTTMNLPFQALQVVNPFLPPPPPVVVPPAVMAKAFGGVTAALPQQSQPPMSAPTGPGAGPAAGPTGPGAGPQAGPGGPGAPGGPAGPGGPGIPGGSIGPGGPTAQQQQAIQQQMEAAVNRAFDQAAAQGAGNIDGAMAAAVQVSAVAATMMASMFAGGPGGPGGFGGLGGPGGPGGAPAFANIAAALNTVVSNAVTAGMAFAGQGPGPGGPQPGGPVGLPGGLPAGLGGFFGPGPGPNGPGGPGSFGPAGPGQFGPAGPGPYGPVGPGQFGPGPFGPGGPGQFGPGGPGDFGGPIGGIFGPGPGDFGGPIGAFGAGFGLFAAEGVFYAGIGEYGILQAQDVTVFETPEYTYIGDFGTGPTTNFDETLIGSSGNDTIPGGAGNTNIYMGNGLLGGRDVVGGGGGTNQLTFDDLNDLRFTLTAGSTANSGTISITTMNGTNYNPASAVLTPYSTSTIEFTDIQQFLFASGAKNFSSGYQTGNTSLNTSAAPTTDADVIIFPSLDPGEKGTVWAGTSGADTITVDSTLAPKGALVFGKDGGDTINMQAMNKGFYIGGATVTDNRETGADGIADTNVNTFTYASLDPTASPVSATGLSISLVAAGAYNSTDNTAGYGGDGLAKDYKDANSDGIADSGWTSTLLHNLWDVGALTGSLGADQIIVSGGGTAGGFAFIAGGGGADTIQLIKGTVGLKVGYVDGGAGNDSYSLGSGLAFGSTFNVIDEGGTGADPGDASDNAIFYLAAGASIAPTVSGVEAITFDLAATGVSATFSGANVTGATSYGANNAIGSGSTLTLTNIGATSFTATNAAGNVNITFGSGVTGPSVTGGNGNDSVTVAATLSSANINGGAGTDSLTLASGTNNSSVTITNVENVYGAGATNSDEQISLAANISGVTFDFGAGTADRVSAPAGGNNFTTQNVEFVYGGSSADTITVGASTDAVTLYGGQGADILNLGSSTVIASYTNSNEFGDTINSFTFGVDKIGFRNDGSQNIFGALDDNGSNSLGVVSLGVNIDFTATANEAIVSTVNTGTDADVVNSAWILSTVIGTATMATGADALIVVKGATKSAVWYFSDANANATAETADLSMVATVDSTAFATGDIQTTAVTA